MTNKIIMIFISFIFSVSTAYADLSDCAKDRNSFHCAYAAGLSVNEGRWVKVKRTFPNQSHNFSVVCLMGSGTISLDQPTKKGTYEEEYSICQDSQGNNCQLLGKQTYIVSSNFISDIVSTTSLYSSPDSYAINFAPVAYNPIFSYCIGKQ